MRTDSLNDKINVNNGVLQGSLISLMLLNIYINYLVVELGDYSFEVLAYADDLAIICNNRKQLDDAIILLTNGPIRMT